MAEYTNDIFEKKRLLFLSSKDGSSIWLFLLSSPGADIYIEKLFL